MTLKIKSSSFYINTNNVEPALNSLKEIYPNTIELLTYEEPVSNLQLLLYCLGYHCRVNVDLSIFTISRCYEPKIENEDSILTLTTLSQYMTEDSYIIAEKDGREIRFEKNSKSVKIEEDTNSSVPPNNKEIEPDISTSIDIPTEIKPTKKRSRTKKTNPSSDNNSTI